MDKGAQRESIKAFFGGTFDPPHYGHFLPLRETADLMQLSTISLLPANVPVFKKNVSAAHHRIAMCELLCQLDSRFTLDLLEFERIETSYTIDTLMQIKQHNPEQKIVFIIGLDSLKTLHLWERWQALFDYSHIVVMRRPTETKETHSLTDFSQKASVASNLYNFYTSPKKFDTIVGPEMDEQTRLFLLSKLALAENNSECINYYAFKDIISNSAKGKLWFVNNHNLPMSSSFVRQQIKSGKVISDWVPESIANYIAQHKLYIK